MLSRPAATLELATPSLGSRPQDPLTCGGTVGIDRSGASFFWMGEGSLRIPMSMHRANREKLCEALRARPEIGKTATILLEGGKELPRYDTDTTFNFKQESNFQYLFGVKEPDFLAALRVQDAHAVLFVPRMEKEYQKWMGPIRPPAWYHRAYDVSEVFHTDELKQTLASMLSSELLVLQGDPNRDSGLRLPIPDVVVELADIAAVNVSGSRVLWDQINECRLIKSAEELEVMQYVNDVSSRAHIEVMRAVRPSQREHVAEAHFRFQASLRGCFGTGYDCICPSGRRNAILHYGHAAEPNAEKVPWDSLRLHDMGAEYHGYTADVTCTFPVSGRFKEAQRLVYNAVWEAVLMVEQAIRPGVHYKDMHRMAQRTLLLEMSKEEVGLLLGPLDAMMAAGVASYFMPHGLGHSVGLDVHDVGGYAPGAFRSDDPTMQENLRLGRELQEGMVITVEPGFYFVDYLIDEALADPRVRPFINQDRLYELWQDVSGVRIEDDVVVTATGCRVLTCVPRTPEEIEAVMAGQEWQVSHGCCRYYQSSAL